METLCQRIRLLSWSSNKLTAAVGAGAAQSIRASRAEGALKTADVCIALRVELGLAPLTRALHF
jgi:hypothetical protein